MPLIGFGYAREALSFDLRNDTSGQFYKTLFKP